MRKILLFLLSAFCYLPGNVVAQDAGNPMNVQFGDPYILRTTGGRYYMYGTGNGAENGFVAYSSADLKNWKREGQVYYGNNKNGWGEILTGRPKYMNGTGSITCSIVRSGKRTQARNRRILKLA